jgi:hypothetical protein
MRHSLTLRVSHEKIGWAGVALNCQAETMGRQMIGRIFDI